MQSRVWCLCLCRAAPRASKSGHVRRQGPATMQLLLYGGIDSDRVFDPSDLAQTTTESEGYPGQNVWILNLLYLSVVMPLPLHFRTALLSQNSGTLLHPSLSTLNLRAKFLDGSWAWNLPVRISTVSSPIWKPSTHKTYFQKWELFQSWCPHHS